VTGYRVEQGDGQSGGTGSFIIIFLKKINIYI
jgi:hypothetical protein